MIVTTESGSIYEFDGMRMRRVSEDKLRQDNEWVNMLLPVTPVVGRSLVIPLECLGETGLATIRKTTRVTHINEYSKG
jgi:hypothetical protein